MLAPFAADLLPGVNWFDDAYKAAQNADALVILTEWNEFRAVDLKRMAKKMAVPHMADLRNIYSVRDAKRAGFLRYVSVGRADHAEAGQLPLAGGHLDCAMILTSYCTHWKGNR